MPSAYLDQHEHNSVEPSFSVHSIECYMSLTRKTKTLNRMGVKGADPESFFRGGPTLNSFFLVDEGREESNTTHYKRAIIGPPAKRWYPNIECWLGSFVVLQGPVLLRNPIFL